MRLSVARPMIFGLVLAIGITLTQPHLTFGAGQSFGKSGSVDASRMHRQHPFRGFGFLGVDEAGDQQVTIIQQFQSASTPEPREPVENRIYVPPRWVDGGYRVQVLEPDTGPFRSKRQSIDPAGSFFKGAPTTHNQVIREELTN